eukprot:9905316-Karenia_brevis.AAC.1
MTQAWQCRQIDHKTAPDLSDYVEGRRGIADFCTHLYDMEMALDKGSCLVYCISGANRSPGFICAWLVARTGCTVDTAFRHVKRLRAIADIYS